VSEFLAAREIWQEPLVAVTIAGALCGLLGVYVVLRRTVFVSAALTQLSTLGLVAALVAEEALGVEVERAGVQLAVATAFSVAGALALGWLVPRRIPAEASVGIAWAGASALGVLGAARLVHAAHDLGGMVFGNAVAVSSAELRFVAAVAAACAALHVALSRRLVFVSFDRETAEAMGVRARAWEALVFLALGLAIPASARVLGALPVFALLTVPASAALLGGLGLGACFAASAAIGGGAAAGGYLVSWVAQLPTGATMVVVVAATVPLAAALRRAARQAVA
jgi:zinc transport system permease protein